MSVDVKDLPHDPAECSACWWIAGGDATGVADPGVFLPMPAGPLTGDGWET